MRRSGVNAFSGATVKTYITHILMKLTLQLQPRGDDADAQRHGAG
jgi:hypothetical protein